MSAPPGPAPSPVAPSITPAVAAVIANYPAVARARFFELRELVFAVAAAHDEVGPLEEALRWGEPAYLTSATGSGTTVRVAWSSKRPDVLGLYVHCQTDLIARFRAFSEGLRFDGNRGVLLPLDAELPRASVQPCVAAALLYHRRGRSGD